MPGFFRGSRIGGAATNPKPTFTGQYETYQHGVYTCVKMLSSGILVLDKIGPYDIFAVGGGGGGGRSVRRSGSYVIAAGGGGGFAVNLFNFAPANGRETINITIGAGGAGGQGDTTSSQIPAEDGKASTFGSYLSALGGGKGLTGIYSGSSAITGNVGGNGGSGGGRGAGAGRGGSGGSDGSDGIGGSGGNTSPGGPEVQFNGIGQHTTTRAFEDQTEILYAGGGGGAGDPQAGSGPVGGFGGAGGGGDAGYSDGAVDSFARPKPGVDGLGGGGGGAAYYAGGSSSYTGGKGGSGVIIIRWKSR